MTDMFASVIKKAEFLVKLCIPDEFHAKDQTKDKDTINFIRESMVKAMVSGKEQ